MRLYQKLSKIIFNTLKNLRIARRPDSRAIGAEIEDEIKNRWKDIVDKIGGINPEFDRERVRTIYDMGFDYKNQFYGVDIKSIDVNRGFTSGGVCAVKNLLDFMVNKKNIFVVCEVGYSTNKKRVIIKYIKVVPFHFIPIDNIHIENLGTGQIQFKESLNSLDIKPISKEVFYENFSRLAVSHYKKVRSVAFERLSSIENFIDSGYKTFKMK